ncbi:MAG: cation diffusion facilitator family transporter [Thaumarchaeota archaeon]|nr:cation diffusion facilitator family transporter [Nitrososphaerota archaeon]
MITTDPAHENSRARILQQISKGQLIAIVSFFVNFVVGILEVGVGLYSGSLALTADGVHGFVDAIVSLTIWFGIRYSQKKADGRFHYGYYKFDAIFSLFAAIIMVASGILISYTGIQAYLQPGPLRRGSNFALAVALISIVTATVLAKGKQSYAKSSGLVSLKTDALNSIKDASASLIAFFGILLASFGFYGFDALAGLIIGVFVMVAGYFAIKESSLILADAYGNPEMLETIRSIAASVLGIQSIGDLRVRRSGPFLAVELHVKVDGNMTVFEADEITRQVSMKMREQIVSLGRVVVKSEPVQNLASKK